MKTKFPDSNEQDLESIQPEKINVDLTQQGNGLYSRSFSTLEAAIEFAEAEWNTNRNDADFIRGGEDRAEWCVWSNGACVWCKQANLA